MLQTLSQRYEERSAGLEEEKKGKLEALYGQLLACGQAMDASKELIETAQEIYRSQDKRLFLKVSQSFRCSEYSRMHEKKELNLDIDIFIDTLFIASFWTLLTECYGHH